MENSVFKPGTTILQNPPTNQEALRVARNALHTLVFHDAIGGNCVEYLAKIAKEKESDYRYALAILDKFLSNEAFLEVIKQECDFSVLDRKYFGLPPKNEEELKGGDL